MALRLRRGLPVGGRKESNHTCVNCRVFFAASRLTAAVAWPRAVLAMRLAALRYMLIQGFFIGCLAGSGWRGAGLSPCRDIPTLIRWLVLTVRPPT